MYVLNPGLYQPSNIYNFIEESVNVLLLNNQGLNSQKEYWLFYYIKEDFFANWISLQNYNIEMDVLGFAHIKRNTRHAIESFLDLYNLSKDADYIEVLKYCAKEKDYNIYKYRNYMYKNQFTIKSKFNIAKCYKGEFKNFIDITHECNSYVHPNVFIDLPTINNMQVKQDVLKRLLSVNIFVFNEAFKILLNKYNGGQYVALSCAGCLYYNCANCHNNIYNNMNNIICSQLLLSVSPQGYNFYPPF